MELYKNHISMTFTATKKRVMRLLMDHVDWSQYYVLSFTGGYIKVQGEFRPDHIQILRDLKFKCTLNDNGHVTCIRGQVEFLFT